MTLIQSCCPGLMGNSLIMIRSFRCRSSGRGKRGGGTPDIESSSPHLTDGKLGHLRSAVNFDTCVAPTPHLSLHTLISTGCALSEHTCHPSPEEMELYVRNFLMELCQMQSAQPFCKTLCMQPWILFKMKTRKSHAKRLAMNSMACVKRSPFVVRPLHL